MVFNGRDVLVKKPLDKDAKLEEKAHDSIQFDVEH